MQRADAQADLPPLGGGATRGVIHGNIGVPRRQMMTKRPPKFATRPYDLPLYRLWEGARFVGIAPSTLRKWVHGRDYRAGGSLRFSRPVIEPADTKTGRLSFANLLEAHILEATRKNHISLPDVRYAIETIRRDEPSERHPLLTGRFYRHGKKLFVESLHEKIAASRPHEGQRPLPQILDSILEQIGRDLDFYLDRISRDDDENPYELFPVRRNENKVVVVNFEIAGGQPVVAGTGIQIEFLRDLQRAGMNITDIASQYRLASDAVAEAIEYLAA
jgi:uncharacterized protein (DUF433 family)